MKIRLLAGAAVVASMGFAVPASAAALTPELPSVETKAQGNEADSAVEAFYAHRANAPLWLTNGQPNAAASQFLATLDRAPLDGLASGPALAAHIRGLLSASNGTAAERALSTAFVRYAQAMRTPPPGMTFADSWVTPRQASAGQLLASAAAAPSLAEHVARIANVNPVYASLRDAAYADLKARGGSPDPRVLASLERARSAPFQSRYVMVDAGSASLYMVENGKVADSMRVIVGKAETETPMLASTIYYATLNPYWNVPADLVRSLIAPRVVSQGIKYLTDHNYDVLDSYAPGAEQIDPKSVDWSAVAAGTRVVKLRQRPSPANSMGQMKFGFPNAQDIYLHDTPNKALFDADSRSVSNGCVRLADAPRFARWLLGRDPELGGAPEQNVLLPTPVPIYITYTTAVARDGQLAFVDDVYGRDRAPASSMAIAARR